MVPCLFVYFLFNKTYLKREENNNIISIASYILINDYKYFLLIELLR